MGSDVWGAEVAEIYDSVEAERFAPDVLGPTVETLFELGRGGPALEFAVGTGRVALPLAAKGIAVSGIELSPHMAAQLSAKPNAERVPVTIGDMTSTRVPGEFALVYLVFNTIMNVQTQEGQVAVFVNAASHLVPGGRFVVEVAPGGTPPAAPEVFAMEANHIGIDTFDDPVNQISSSHHWWVVDGQLRHSVGTFRFVYPSELDLMARVAGMRLHERWADWDRSAFTATSTNQVVVYEKVG